MEKNDVMFAIIFATVVLVLLAGFLFFFFLKYRYRSNEYIKEREIMKKTFEQTLLQSQIEVQEATFSALGKELHDNIGQLLSSTKMLLGITQRNLKDTPETLTIAVETLGKAINELRALSKSIDKEWLDQFDLVENLSTEITRINNAKMLQIQFSHPGRLPMKAEEQIILFRIIQEALQNAIKHSEAQNIRIEIATQTQNILVTITDDGKGLGSISTDGLGMRNMKQRTKLLGGNITWSMPTRGSSINIQLPVKEEEYENFNRHR
ncbi:MAG: ATP-binding protein [Ginsengibacter sp.]